MKNSTVKRKNKKTRFFQIGLLFALLFTPILSNSAAYSINSPSYDTPPKITSSIDCLPPVNIAAIQPTKSGNWNDASIWPGNNLPNNNDDITIPQSMTITLVGICRAKTIRVNGILNAGNQAIDLETESIIVAGAMEIGTESQPYAAEGKCIITLKGNKINNPISSHKGILVIDGGILELHGKKRTSWTNLSETADSGSNQITLTEAVDWEIGDKIALTATGLATDQSKAWNNVDEAEITAISENRRTLTLRNPLKYKHIGGSKSYTRPTDGKKWTVNIQGEVGLLSHYIKIQGDETDTGRGFGGHIMLMKGSISHSENIELYRMGQKGVLGRYPYHWHLNEDQSKDSYLRNSSVHKSFNRAVTIHGTDYVTVDGVFAYDHIGHGIFLEDGGERYNTIKNNVVFITRRPSNADRLTPSDNEKDELQNRTPASYWITNPNNYFENNVAAGTEGTGFWFAFPERPLFDSGELDYFKGIVPWQEPLGKFEGFVVHTCRNGWDVFDRLNDDHSLKANWGWRVETPQYITNGLFYGNEQALYSGLGVGGINKNTIFSDCIFSDNRTVSMLAGDLTIENSLFNVDTELGVFEGTREFYRFYDGPGRHFDCHFEGWNRSNAEMFKQVEGGGATENFNPSFKGITKGFSEPFRFRFAPIINEDDSAGRKAGQCFKDMDGSMLGSPGTLIRDYAFLRDGSEYRHPSWVGAAKVDYFFAGLWLHQVQGTGTNVAVERTKPGTENACLYNAATGTTLKFPMIVNEGFTYNYYFDRAPNSRYIHAIWYRGTNSDLGLACFKGFAKLGNIRVSGAQRVNSKAQVEAATETAYFIDQNDVYVMFESREGDDRRTVDIRWDNNGSFQPQNLPCTINDFSPGENTNPLSVAFINPVADQLEVGADLGVVVDVLDGTATNVRLYINDVFVRQEGVYPYEWGTSNPGQNDEALLNLAEGTYELKAVATDNLGKSVTITKTITVTEDTLQISENEDKSFIKLHPNPFQDNLYISGKTSGKLVKIYDILGVVKVTTELTEGENIINMAALSSGLYLVKVLDPSSKSRTVTYKIIKTK